MAILITGGAGFVGSHLAERMAAETTEQIICLDNFNDYYDPQLKRSNAASINTHERITVIEGDFCDFEANCQLMKTHEIDRIVHLGAYAGVRYSVENPFIYEQANVGGTLSLLEAARKHSLKRFLLISSSTVYGCGAAIPFREDAPLGIPASPYGSSKRAAELMGLTYHQLHQVPVVCLRPFSVYGPRLRPDLALTIFADAIENGKTFPLFGDGTIRRDYTHVSDICQGLKSALYAEGIDGETFNLGHSHPVEIRHIIEMIEKSLGKKAQIDRQPERPEDLPVTFADLTKAEQHLGYSPQVPIEQGINEFCHWFRQWHQNQ
ncbi:MAG: NAD-dependent epimerase/dehydratase family protein [Planctomycetaceae bacterium]|nr:NAD-dependent epimerase/dehydratase family protein [Planctomycetaceae bacterium]